MTALGLGPAPARRALLVRRVRLLVAATITYNLVEAAVALTAGSLASSTALVGLAANALLGWWWADPVAALVIGLVAAREGVEAWRGDSCCAGCAAPS